MIRHLLNQKNVERLSGKYKIRSYNLLEHSYLVLNLYLELCKEECELVSVEQIDAILKHDITETISLDLPYPVKNLNIETKESWAIIENESVKWFAPELLPYTDENLKKKFSDNQYNIFKLCDLLELWIFCKEEQRFGNKTTEIQKIIDKCFGLLEGKFPYIDKVMREF